MKDLPKVFANKIDKDLKNYQELYYSSNNDVRRVYDNKNINKKIDDIFSSNTFISKSRVLITTKDEILEKIIIGKTSNSLLTIEGEKIKISDILDIERQ